MKQQTISKHTLLFAMALMTLIGLAGLMSGQEAAKDSTAAIKDSKAASKTLPRTPGIQDWSTHHVNFSAPESAEQTQKDSSAARLKALQNNTRYKMVMAARAADLARKSSGATSAVTEAPTADEAESLLSSAGITSAATKSSPAKTTKPTKPQGDWNNYLGGASGAGVSNPWYPAKYTWDIYGAPSCTKDAVVVPINKAVTNETTSSATGDVGTITSLSGTATAGTYTLTVQVGSGSVLTLRSTPPIAASQSGSFTASSISGTVTVDGNTYTAEPGTAGTGSIALASSYCFAPSSGIDVAGVTFTTAGSAGTAGSFTVSNTTAPTNGGTVAIGGVTYTTETTLGGTTPYYQVLIPALGGSGCGFSGTWNSTCANNMARNLSVAINKSGTCGSTSGGVCTRNVTAANSMVTSTNTATTLTENLTPLCTGNAAITFTASDNITFTSTGAGPGGTQSATQFAISTTNSLTAANIVMDITGNATTHAIFPTVSNSSGTISLTAETGAAPWTLSTSGTLFNVTASYTAGGAGTTSSSAKTFATSTDSTTQSTNLANEALALEGDINTDDSNVTATVNGSGGITITAKTPGPGGDGIGLGKTISSGFTWSGGAISLANGSNGVTSGTSFAYWNGTVPVDSLTLANTLATLITNNSSAVAVSNSTSNPFTITSNTPGAAGNITAGGTLSPSFFTWTPTNGTNGQASIVAFNQLYSGGGSDAMQTGTASTNIDNQSSGGTIKINSTTLTAVSPTPQIEEFIESGSEPAGGTTLTIQGINYTFETSTPLATNPPANTCYVYSNTGSHTTTNTDLFDAITNTGGNNTGVYECASGAAPNPKLTSVANSTCGVSHCVVATASLAAGLETITFTNGTAYTTTQTQARSDGSNSGSGFAYWSGGVPASTTQLAANIATSINDNLTLQLSTGVSATSNGDQVTVTARTGGTAGNSITTTANLTGFSWGGGMLAGGQPAPCTGPAVDWAYAANSTADGIMLGSPIMSYDGTQVAFVESSPTSGSTLHILAWHAGDNASNSLDSNPTTLLPANIFTSTEGAAYRTCAAAGTAACMINLPMGAATDTYSPPFYDFDNDNIYVGDDGGHLYQFTNVFIGDPGPGTGAWASGWQQFASYPLTGPVPDYYTASATPPAYIMVTDIHGGVYQISTTTAAYVNTASVDGATPSDPVITDPIIEDASTGYIYVFSGGGPGSGQAYVTQTPIGLTVSSPAGVGVGANTDSEQFHAGYFDNNYWNNPSTGHLYMCAKDPTNDFPSLWDIGFNADNTMGLTATSLNGSTTTVLDLGSQAGQCSPIQEIFNPNQGATGTDWIFVGIPSDCAFSGSLNGCIESFNVTNGFPTTASATGAEQGGTSGIIVDNITTTPGASSVYFTTGSSPGAGACFSGSGQVAEPSSDSTTCLVKRTQQGLN